MPREITRKEVEGYRDAEDPFAYCLDLLGLQDDEVDLDDVVELEEVIFEKAAELGIPAV